MIYPIFLSHSSHDKELAKTIKEEIEKELGINMVFLSPRISSGKDWFETVIDNLQHCDVIIILLTKPASDSLWVGFELGFVWEKLRLQEKIHILYHPNVEKIPNPLDKLQGKSIAERTDLKEFFEKLCEQFSKSFEARANLYQITYVASSTITPTPDRSLIKFDEYLSDPDNWLKVWDNQKESWICKKDVLYHIEINHRESGREFREEWMKNLILPDPSASQFNVRLKIASVTVDVLVFIILDGGRFKVPMPEIKNAHYTDDGEFLNRDFYWDKNSFEFKVGRIIENFEMVSTYYRSLEYIAYKAGIEIID